MNLSESFHDHEEDNHFKLGVINRLKVHVWLSIQALVRVQRSYRLSSWVHFIFADLVFYPRQAFNNNCIYFVERFSQQEANKE